MDTHEKKALANDWTVVIEDESGFNLFPILARTWAPVGQTPILMEPPKRGNHSAIGMLALTRRLTRCQFLFTISPESVLTDDLIFWLTFLHFHYRKTILMVWDNLPGHKAAEAYFNAFRPGWYHFESFPAYSPELNPVEYCWNDMKSNDLSNFVSESTEELVRATVASAIRINGDADAMKSYFRQAGLTL